MTVLVVCNVVMNVIALAILAFLVFAERRANRTRHATNEALLLSVEAEARTVRHALKNVAGALRMHAIARSLEDGPDLREGIKSKSADGREKEG